MIMDAIVASGHAGHDLRRRVPPVSSAAATGHHPGHGRLVCVGADRQHVARRLAVQRFQQQRRHARQLRQRLGGGRHPRGGGHVRRDRAVVGDRAQPDRTRVHRQRERRVATWTASMATTARARSGAPSASPAPPWCRWSWTTSRRHERRHARRALDPRRELFPPPLQRCGIGDNFKNYYYGMFNFAKAMRSAQPGAGGRHRHARRGRAGRCRLRPERGVRRERRATLRLVQRRDAGSGAHDHRLSDPAGQSQHGGFCGAAAAGPVPQHRRLHGSPGQQPGSAIRTIQHAVGDADPDPHRSFRQVPSPSPARDRTRRRERPVTLDPSDPSTRIRRTRSCCTSGTSTTTACSTPARTRRRGHAQLHASRRLVPCTSR